MDLPGRPHALPHPELPTKTLLVVEDDRATLSLYRAGLKGLQGFRVLTAQDGKQALDVLRREPVHVLVTDLNMPVMDGFNLIAKTSCLHPQVPIIVMTGLDESQHLNTPLQMGAIRILAKPPRLTLLMDAIRTAAQFQPTGMVRGDRPDIEFVETCRVERTMDMPLTELLMNAAMLTDHHRPEFGEA
ncbi:MAG: response regulator [Acidobacteria bacterium]|nr:response regulator [Acidobacteriota bacterium]